MNEFEVENDKKRILEGRNRWDEISEKLKVNMSTVVLCLADENNLLDHKALEYLPNFVKRKNADRAEILVLNDNARERAAKFSYTFEARITVIDGETMRQIYDYYCFAFNFDNIAFTFLGQCPYNLMDRILNETDITEEEAVCLGVYWLREMQERITDV